MNKALKYGTGLIALYIIVYKGSQSGRLISAGARGGRDLVRAFQGR